jgi:hypothetical protein
VRRFQPLLSNGSNLCAAYPPVLDFLDLFKKELALKKESGMDLDVTAGRAQPLTPPDPYVKPAWFQRSSL